MPHTIDTDQILAATRSDKELTYKLRGYSGRARFTFPIGDVDIVIKDGAPVSVAKGEGDAAVTYRGTDDFWNTALGSATPPPWCESLTMAGGVGMYLEGDFVRVVTTWQGCSSRGSFLTQTEGLAMSWLQHRWIAAYRLSPWKCGCARQARVRCACRSPRQACATTMCRRCVGVRGRDCGGDARVDVRI